MRDRSARERGSGRAAAQHRDVAVAQGRTTEARQVLEPLHQDMCMVFGPDDEMTVEIATALALIRLDADGDAAG